MKKVTIMCFLSILLLPQLVFSQTAWKLVTYNVSFKIKNAGITVTGKFSGLKTAIMFGPDKLGASALKGSVDVATIKTGIDKRDKDLLGEKYFNADKYKTIELASTKLYKKGNQYAGTFNVTIKGVTKQIEMLFTFAESGDVADITGSFPLKRSDFGIGGKTLTMSDDLTVDISVKVKK